MKNEINNYEPERRTIDIKRGRHTFAITYSPNEERSRSELGRYLLKMARDENIPFDWVDAIILTSKMDRAREH